MVLSAESWSIQNAIGVIENDRRCECVRFTLKRVCFICSWERLLYILYYIYNSDTKHIYNIHQIYTYVLHKCVCGFLTRVHHVQVRTVMGILFVLGRCVLLLGQRGKIQHMVQSEMHINPPAKAICGHAICVACCVCALEGVCIRKKDGVHTDTHCGGSSIWWSTLCAQQHKSKAIWTIRTNRTLCNHVLWILSFVYVCFVWFDCIRLCLKLCLLFV